MDALLVAQGELLQLVLGAFPKIQALQQILRGVGGSGLVHAVEAAEEAQLVCDLLLVIEPALLWHVADPAAQVVVHGGATQADLARVSCQDPQSDAHRRGLAGAIRTDEAVDLARLDGKAHVLQNVVVAVEFV